MKPVNRNSFIFLGFLLILYFGVNLYFNYKSQMLTDEITPVSSEELKSCSIEEIEDNRVKLTVPSPYVGDGVTQENLDVVAQKCGYEAITLNEDGSATYLITKEQQQSMVTNLATGIKDKLIVTAGSKNYKHITNIEANEDFLHYTVTLDTNSLDTSSAMISSLLKSYSTMYYCYQGIIGETINITYVYSNGSTQEYTAVIE